MQRAPWRGRDQSDLNGRLSHPSPSVAPSGGVAASLPSGEIQAQHQARSSCRTCSIEDSQSAAAAVSLRRFEPTRGGAARPTGVIYFTPSKRAHVLVALTSASPALRSRYWRRRVLPPHRRFSTSDIGRGTS